MPIPENVIRNCLKEFLLTFGGFVTTISANSHFHNNFTQNYIILVYIRPKQDQSSDARAGYANIKKNTFQRSGYPKLIVPPTPRNGFSFISLGTIFYALIYRVLIYFQWTKLLSKTITLFYKKKLDQCPSQFLLFRLPCKALSQQEAFHQS